MLIDKNDLPMVAMDNMNDVHVEDVEIINSLSMLIDEYAQEQSDEICTKINDQYKLWQEHTVGHFEGEEQMMLAKGFFAYPMHKGEHDNALYAMNEIFSQWQNSRDITILQRYIQQDLPEWLVNHIASMDTVTAMFLKTGTTPCHG